MSLAETPVYHTYATTVQFKAYLQGSGGGPRWTEDEIAVLRGLEAASRRIDRYLGRSIGPRTETRLYDLRQPRAAGEAIDLDDWLIAAATVTVYEGSAHMAPVTVPAGIAGGYLLWPYQGTPKTRLILADTAAVTAGAGQQTVSIAGTWGYAERLRPLTALNGSIAAGDALVSVTTAVVEPGMTVRIDAEQLAVIGVGGSGSTAGRVLSVRRGVHGTAAAAHLSGAAVSVYEYDAGVVDLTLEIARLRWRDRDSGLNQTLGEPEQQASRPSQSERTALKRLDPLLGERDGGGVWF